MKQYKCPKCKSKLTNIISTDRNTKTKTTVDFMPFGMSTVKQKKPTVSKGKLALAMMTGGGSLMLTGINNNKHTEVQCCSCGYRWLTK